MSVAFSEEENNLLALLNAALNKTQTDGLRDTETDVDCVLEEAKKHAVISVLYDVLEQISLTEKQREQIEKHSRQIVLQNYRLLFLTKYLVELLEKNQVPTVILKGVSTASWYPVPELRKSGDVDLMIPKDIKLAKVVDILKAVGFVEKTQQHANYHMELVSQDGIAVEIHTEFTEKFADKRINIAMEQQVQGGFTSAVMDNVMGIKLPVLSRVYHAYELLLHMLHHFTTSGFGLKLLCDWVVCWNQDWSREEKDYFRRLTKESATERFAEAVTEVCAVYLGLNRENYAWDYVATELPTQELMREILDAEEFGRNDNNRMVMMGGTGLTDYIKEFHHQMHLNFPKAGKCFLLWPVLWVITLVRFLRNNKRVRNTSAREILREAKRRSELMERLKL